MAALLIVVGVVFVEQGQRRIPVQYAKRMVGRRMYGGTSTYLPLKVNQAGVIPVIFASSLLYIPGLITQLVRSGGNKEKTGWWDRFVSTYLTDPSNYWYIAIYFTLIVFFTFFYVSITFNPDERADEMNKFGGFIPAFVRGAPPPTTCAMCSTALRGRARSTWASSPSCRTCSCRSVAPEAHRTCRSAELRYSS